MLVENQIIKENVLYTAETVLKNEAKRTITFHGKKGNHEKIKLGSLTVYGYSFPYLTDIINGWVDSNIDSINDKFLAQETTI